MRYPTEPYSGGFDTARSTLVHSLSPVACLSLIIVIYLLFHAVYLHFSSPIAKVPGPFIAKFSRWWLAYHGWRGDFHRLLTGLHAKYGEVVRIGPDEIITISPDAVKKIYGKSIW